MWNGSKGANNGCNERVVFRNAMQSMLEKTPIMKAAKLREKVSK